MLLSYRSAGLMTMLRCLTGFGATSTVRLATYKPLNQVVAVKVMDFEGSSSIRMMQREVELMSLSKHPNVSA